MDVVLRTFLCFNESPMLPNTYPNISLARYGMLLNIPASVNLNCKTSLINLGAAVMRKKSPKVPPK